MPLSEKGFYGIGGRAEFFAEPESLQEVREMLAICHADKHPWRVMGGGTNLLIGDGLIPGYTLQLKGQAFSTIVQEGPRWIAGSAVQTTHLVKKAVEAGFGAASGLGGIPGTLGGAVAMNAGGHEAEVGDFVVEVRGFDATGREKVWNHQECGFAYRTSAFKNQCLITGVVLEFGSCDEGALERHRLWVKNKIANQPYAQRSAGCMFKNPPGASAGRLIDLSGLKGRRVGDAMVSPLHANFIVNLGKATYEDVRALMDEIRGQVKLDHGVDLEPEVVIWESARK
ncbi:MAG: UDP-N-acetylmuramate dehydrogenase [Planctomycetota bacterium]